MILAILTSAEFWERIGFGLAFYLVSQTVWLLILWASRTWDYKWPPKQTITLNQAGREQVIESTSYWQARRRPRS